MHLMYYTNDQGKRVYTLDKQSPTGEVTKSAHPARFSPDDKYSRHRLTLKQRFNMWPFQSMNARGDFCWVGAELTFCRGPETSRGEVESPRDLERSHCTARALGLKVTVKATEVPKRFIFHVKENRNLASTFQCCMFHLRLVGFGAWKLYRNQEHVRASQIKATSMFYLFLEFTPLPAPIFGLPPGRSSLLPLKMDGR